LTLLTLGKFTAIRLAQLPDASLSDGAGGRGTIRFGPRVSLWWASRGFGTWMPSLDPMPQFIVIEDARRVFDEVQRAARDTT